jgi:ankyrin repeat protein
MKISIIFFILLTSVFANGWQEIHRAVFNGDLNSLQKSVDSNRTLLNAETDAGLTPLHIAVKIRDIVAVEKLLEFGADPDSADSRGRTPLLYAISQGRDRIAKKLILSGADPELANDSGITPLHQASYSNRVNMVKFLLNIGVDHTIESENGLTAFQIAYRKGNYQIANYFIALFGKKRD